MSLRTLAHGSSPAGVAERRASRLHRGYAKVFDPSASASAIRFSSTSSGRPYASDPLSRLPNDVIIHHVLPSPPPAFALDLLNGLDLT
jgi:hypothetical protein